MKAPRWMSMSLAVGLTIVTAWPAGAQGTRPTPSGTGPFADIDASLARIEAGLGQIERTQKVTESFDLDAEIATYRDRLRKAYDASLQAAQDEAKKEQTRKGAGAGAGQRLQAWETKAANHPPRVEKVLNRVMTINLKVRDGRVMIAPELLRKLPAEEMDELRKWLTPAAIKKYQAIDPSLFASASMDPRNMLVWLGDALVSEAEGAVAITCVPVCSATPAACIPCVGAVVGVGSFLVTKLDEAFAECDKLRTRFLRGACKVGAVLALITLIA